MDANGLRKALQIGSDLIASPIVDHVRQQRAWDCGLACVLMAAPHARRQKKTEVKWNDVEKACGTRSVWTVDLAFALRALGCPRFSFSDEDHGVRPVLRAARFLSEGTSGPILHESNRCFDGRSRAKCP